MTFYNETKNARRGCPIQPCTWNVEDAFPPIVSREESIRYTIPMPQDSPIAGQDSESLTLPSAVLPTVRLGTPERTRTSAFGSGGRHSIR